MWDKGRKGIVCKGLGDLKRGEGTKIEKKGEEEQTGSWDGFLKKGGGGGELEPPPPPPSWNPVTTCGDWLLREV